MRSLLPAALLLACLGTLLPGCAPYFAYQERFEVPSGELPPGVRLAFDDVEHEFWGILVPTFPVSWRYTDAELTLRIELEPDLELDPNGLRLHAGETIFAPALLHAPRHGREYLVRFDADTLHVPLTLCLAGLTRAGEPQPPRWLTVARRDWWYVILLPYNSGFDPEGGGA